MDANASWILSTSKRLVPGPWCEVDEDVYVAAVVVVFTGDASEDASVGHTVPAQHRTQLAPVRGHQPTTGDGMLGMAQW